MLHLMGTGFKDICVLSRENNTEILPSYTLPGSVVVGKYPLAALIASRFLDIPNSGVIYMVRDFRDACTSTHYKKPDSFWLAPEEWITKIEIALQIRGQKNVALVRYEDLIQQPKLIQSEIALRFELVPTCDFDKCYSHFQNVPEESEKTMNSARAMDVSRVGNWKDCPEKVAYIESIIAEYPILVDLNRKLGYLD